MNVSEFFLFPTYVMKFDLCNHVDSSELIKNYKGDAHHLVTEGTSTYSYGDNLLENYPAIQNKIQECIDLYSKNMGFAQLKIQNSWMNCMTYGSKTVLHRHEGSVISGAYYPKVDDNSAQLVFSSPIKVHRMNDVFYQENPLNTYFNYFPAETDMLYLFPSWLEHETEINQTNERYVLSFNTIAKK